MWRILDFLLYVPHLLLESINIQKVRANRLNETLTRNKLKINICEKVIFTIQRGLVIKKAAVSIVMVSFNEFDGDAFLYRSIFRCALFGVVGKDTTEVDVALD